MRFEAKPLCKSAVVVSVTRLGDFWLPIFYQKYPEYYVTFSASLKNITFWANLSKVGQLLIPTSGHTGGGGPVVKALRTSLEYVTSLFSIENKNLVGIRM